jgi:predicted PurR-regulated permease PerM
MTASQMRPDEPPRVVSGRAPKPLGAGEARAVMLAVAAVAFFLYLIRSILLPFILAGVVAYICTPLLDWLAKRTRLPRLLFAILVFLVLLGAAGLIMTLAAQRLVIEATGTASDLQTVLQNLTQQTLGDGPINIFGQSMTADQITQIALDRIRAWFGQTDQLALATGYSLAFIMGTVLTFVLLFYFLANGRSVARGLFWIVPPHRRELVGRIWSRLDPVLKRYILGVITVVIYAAIAAYIGLGVILGIRHAVLLALLTGILETVPVVGPTSAAIIAGLVSLRTATGIASILAYAIYATVLRLSIDQIVGPIVLGRAANLHPVLIIFCFLSGAILVGIPGVILAVPVALIVKNTLATLYGDARD